ncbi:MAG: hypothetical protein Q4F72_11105 [Desulfovibrionaceae bacterium]|nr:hypothetical protein [Desulfovibrionaceae bacterium]
MLKQTRLLWPALALAVCTLVFCAADGLCAETRFGQDPERNARLFTNRAGWKEMLLRDADRYYREGMRACYQMLKARYVKVKDTPLNRTAVRDMQELFSMNWILILDIMNTHLSMESPKATTADRRAGEKIMKEHEKYMESLVHVADVEAFVLGRTGMDEAQYDALQNYLIDIWKRNVRGW